LDDTFNILTDDLLVKDLISSYCFKNPNDKISVDYISKKEVTIFKYFNEYSKKRYDLIIGEDHKDTSFKFNNLLDLKHYFKNKNTDDYYPFLKDYAASNFYKAIPYELNFFVILTKNSSTSKNSFDSMSLKDLSLSAKSLNVNSENYYKIAFSPYLTSLKIEDWFFLFNSTIRLERDKISFISEESKSALNFVINYDDENNFGIKKSISYAKNYKEYSKKRFLINDILLFDIMPISEALSYDKNIYKILLIEDSRFTMLNQKVVAIAKNTKNRELCYSIIDFILSDETQKKLYYISKERDYYFNEIFLPLLSNSSYLKDEGFNEKFFKYTNSLKPIDLYDQKYREKFIRGLRKTSEMTDKGNITDREFLTFFEKELK